MLDLAWGYRPWSLSHPGQVFNLQIFCAVCVHRETTKGGKGYISNHFVQRYNMAPTTSGNGVRKSWYHPGRWCEVPDYLLVPLGNFMSITEVPPAFAIWFCFGGEKNPNWKNWCMVFEPFWSDVGKCREIGKCREMSGNLDSVILEFIRRIQFHASPCSKRGTTWQHMDLQDTDAKLPWGPGFTCSPGLWYWSQFFRESSQIQ